MVDDGRQGSEAKSAKGLSESALERNVPERAAERATPTDAVLPVAPFRRGAAEVAPNRRGLFIVIPLVMAAAGVAGLVLTGMKDNAIYSKPVDELVAQKARFAGRPVRAEGNLVHGSLMKRETPCEYRFSIQKNGVTLPVRFAQCIVPDTFRDVPNMDVGVTVEGELHADNTFEATSVLAKCPSKYEMQDRAAHGEKMPHGPQAAIDPQAPAQAAY
jgi:cytochrome c-type biogenesis protein CcmE